MERTKIHDIIDNRTVLLKDEIKLNERQKKAIEFVKEKGRITNSEYQKLNNTTRETAKLDLDKMLRLEIFERRGSGRGIFYTLSGNWVKLGKNGEMV